MEIRYCLTISSNYIIDTQPMNKSNGWMFDGWYIKMGNAKYWESCAHAQGLEAC